MIVVIEDVVVVIVVVAFQPPFFADAAIHLLGFEIVTINLRNRVPGSVGIPFSPF